MGRAPRERCPVSVNRIRTYVRGFDEALGGGIPEGYVVLVSGAPGTMKSSFCYSVLRNNAIHENRRAAYFTLEQGRDILLEHMRELGLEGEGEPKNPVVLDMGSIRKNMDFVHSRTSWIELFKMYAANLAKEEKISLLVLDSLDVLETMARFQERRSDLYYLFEWLRDLETTSLVVSERPMDLPVNGRFDEETYLADGLIQLGLHPTSDLYMQRRVRCVKMRSTKHETGYYSLAFDSGKFEVTRAVGGMG